MFRSMIGWRAMIDLHTHSTYSDGTLSPEELLEEAQRLSLRAVAITDHDTLEGYAAAMPVAERYGVELVCGVEISTQLCRPPAPKLALHLLGYFPASAPGAGFRAWLNSISSTRYRRNLKLMERLQSLDLKISWQDFPNPDPCHITRPDFAHVLVAKNYAPNPQAAFNRFLDDVHLAGIAPELPLTEEAIRQITKEGGIASLAHPGRLRCSDSMPLESVIRDLAGQGLDAIEVYHSGHSPGQVCAFLQTAAALGLLATGGSDFHGRNKPHVQLGVSSGHDLGLPYALWTGIKEYHRKKFSA
jgi:3',5'-nucleoside bisphosphate phosphatase